MAGTLFTSALLFAASALAAPAANTKASAAVTKSGSLYNVPGVASFTHGQTFDFSKLNALPDGLAVSPDHIGKSGDAKFTQDYTEENVKVSGGALQMTVPGGQSGPSIQGAEIASSARVLYGSIRTTAKIGASEGVCAGEFKVPP